MEFKLGEKNAFWKEAGGDVGVLFGFPGVWKQSVNYKKFAMRFSKFQYIILTMRN